MSNSNNPNTSNLKKKDIEDAFDNEFKLISYNEAEKKIRENVKGQDSAVERILTTIFRSYDEVEKQEPTIILLLGPTGVGKSLIVKEIIKALNVPYAIENANDLTKAGYEGEDINDMFYNLVQNTKDFTALNKGIVFLDEIDKLVGYSQDDVGGASVYKALLAPFDGRELIVNPPKNVKTSSRRQKLDTSKLIFILAGAFDGLSKVREKRLTKKNQMGFTSNNKDDSKKIPKFMKEYIKEDIINYGILPEFVGRISTMVELKEHDLKTLVEIVRDAKGSKYKRYINTLKEKYNITVKVYDKFYEDVANEANSIGTGAREIVTVINFVFEKIFNEVYRNKIINKVCVLQKGIVEDNTKFTWEDNDKER